MNFYFVFPADLAFEDLYFNNPVLQICSDFTKKQQKPTQNLSKIA